MVDLGADRSELDTVTAYCKHLNVSVLPYLPSTVGKLAKSNIRRVCGHLITAEPVIYRHYTRRQVKGDVVQGPAKTTNLYFYNMFSLRHLWFIFTGKNK